MWRFPVENDVVKKPRRGCFCIGTGNRKCGWGPQTWTESTLERRRPQIFYLLCLPILAPVIPATINKHPSLGLRMQMRSGVTGVQEQLSFCCHAFHSNTDLSNSISWWTFYEENEYMLESLSLSHSLPRFLSQSHDSPYKEIFIVEGWPDIFFPARGVFCISYVLWPTSP